MRLLIPFTVILTMIAPLPAQQPKPQKSTKALTEQDLVSRERRSRVRWSSIDRDVS